MYEKQNPRYHKQSKGREVMIWVLCILWFALGIEFGIDIGKRLSK